MSDIGDILFQIFMGAVLAICTGLGALVVYEASSWVEVAFGLSVGSFGAVGTVMATVFALRMVRAAS